MPRRASLKSVECPILFRATPQPSTGRRSVRSKANPHRRQGILETTHRHPKPTSTRARARTAIIIQGNLRAQVEGRGSGGFERALARLALDREYVHGTSRGPDEQGVGVARPRPPKAREQ